MTPEEISSAASETRNWIECAIGDLAYGIASDPWIDDHWGQRIIKAKADGVRDIHGWLADEMYNDVDCLQDLLGDHIYDHGKTDKDRIAIAERVAEIAHSAMVKACCNLVAEWMARR